MGTAGFRSYKSDLPQILCDIFFTAQYPTGLQRVWEVVSMSLAQIGSSICTEV